MSNASLLADPADFEAHSAAPLFVVLNGASGRQQVDEARELLTRMFAEAGRHAEVKVARRSRQLPLLIEQAVTQARDNAGIVVAAGGDGTLNAVAQAVLPTGLPMGVLPQGTFSFFGRGLGVPSDTAEAARLLLDAVPRPVQVGLVNGHVFLVNASLGLHPQLLEDRENFTRRFGRNRVVALWAALVTLLQRHREMVIEVQRDGQPALINTTTLFVGNNRPQLERLGIAEAEALAQGLLVGVSLKPVGRLAMAGLLLRTALGRLGEAAPVDSVAFREMAVRPWGRRGVRVALDGEMMRLATPLHFTVSPQPLRVMMPRPAEPEASR